MSVDLIRRKLLVGLGALIAAPAVVRAGILMPIRGIVMPVAEPDYFACVVHPSIFRDILLASGGQLEWLRDRYRIDICEVQQIPCS